MYTVLAMATPDYADTWRFCIESHKRYCQDHGFSYEIHENPLPDLNAKWSKIQYTINALRHSEAVMLIDADAEFSKDCPSFASVMDEHPGADIFYAIGRSGRLNSGVMMFRGEVGIRYLQECLDRRHVPVDKEFFVTAEGENGHLISVMAEAPYNDHAKIIPRSWNCTDTECFRGAHIRHYTSALRRALDDGQLGFRRPGESPLRTVKNMVRNFGRPRL